MIVLSVRSTKPLLKCKNKKRSLNERTRVPISVDNHGILSFRTTVLSKSKNILTLQIARVTCHPSPFDASIQIVPRLNIELLATSSLDFFFATSRWNSRALLFTNIPCLMVILPLLGKQVT